MPLLNSRLSRILLTATACSALLLGCATKNDPSATGSIRGPSTGIEQKAASLRATGKADEAVTLLRGALSKNPKSRGLLLAYGRALADAGRDEEALAALVTAQGGARPDWRIVNTEGAVLDKLGRTMDAQQRYQVALRLAPEEPSILSNLGLSLALSQKPTEAEAVLRRAVANPAATPKIRQNLALVLALQGKYDEAEQLVRRDLPPDQAAANVRFWKQSLKATTVSAPAAMKPLASEKAAKPLASEKPAQQAPALSSLDLRG
jgi:Flp pilus assembly protein TadD